MNKLPFTTLLFILLALCGKSQNTKSDNVRLNEVGFMLRSYQSISADPLRGLPQEEWDKRVNKLKEKVAYSHYYFAFRYFAPLINDCHTAFPDGGVYNKNGVFQKKDTLFPVWVKSTEDNRVFVVHDYAGSIPNNSELLEVNGFITRELSAAQHHLNFSELRYAYAYTNAYEEGDFRVWLNFSNYLFCEQIHPPYKVRYCLNGDTSTVLLNGMLRGELHKQYKKKGFMKQVSSTNNFKKTPVSYHRFNDSIGVLDINLFWGKNPLNLLLSSHDSRYNKLLKRCMKQVEKDGVRHLVVDVRGNPGGFFASVYETLGYFTDTCFSRKVYYKVSAETKKSNAPKVIANTYKTLYGKKEKEKQKASVDIFMNMPEGSLFPIDTLLSTQICPQKKKYAYKGKMYVLSDALVYSGGIMFCNEVRDSGCGIIAGSAPGGYSRVTGGPRAYVKLPKYTSWMRMGVSYSTDLSKKCEYLQPDWPLEPSFDEWLAGQDHRLEQLIEKIMSR